MTPMQMHVSVSQRLSGQGGHAEGRCTTQHRQAGQAHGRSGGRGLLPAARKEEVEGPLGQPDMLGQCARGPCTVHPATDDAAQTAAASIYGLELPEMNNYVELCSAAKQKHISCM